MNAVNATQRGPRRQALTLVGCLLLAACSAKSCDPTPDEGANPPVEAALPPPTFQLAIVTDLKGYLEPCGCTSRPLGGIDRVAARLAATRAAGPTLTLLAGDMFFSGESHGPHASAPQHAEEASHNTADTASTPSFAQRAQAAQDALNAEALADVLARFDVAAALPGPHDVAEAERLEALAARADIRLLGRETSQALRHEAAGRSVLVLGILEEDPEAAAAATRALLETPANATRDLVVALTRGGRRTARAVAQVRGVNVVVLGGADTDEALPPSNAGEAVILHASRQGQGVTVAGIYLPPAGTASSGPVVDASPWSAAVRRTSLEADIAELSGSIARWEQEGANADQLARQRGRLARMQAELEGVLAPDVPTDRLALAATFFELPPEAPQDAEVTSAMEALARRINEHNRTELAGWAPVPLAAGEPHFVGSASCESCHTQAYAWWRSHPHGRAYNTLEVRHKQFNLSCVGCHVTGYLQPGGSTVTHLRNGALANVGCENCHGPGGAHVASGGGVAPARTAVPESVCVGCHNPEHSDRFVYEPFRRTLLVPGHGLPSSVSPSGSP